MSRFLETVRSKLELPAMQARKNRTKLEIVFVSTVAVSLLRELSSSVFGFNIPLKNHFVLLWLIVVYLFKLTPFVTLTLALILIAICPAFLMFGAISLADQSANLAYFLMVISFAQQIFELRKVNFYDGGD